MKNNPSASEERGSGACTESESSDRGSTAALSARAVLLLGDPKLRIVSTSVADLCDPEIRNEIDELHQRLAIFRKEHGFGRAISAPQIGITKRFIAMNLNGELHTIINPEITWKSQDEFTMWDDCMSFPSLLVRLRRHKSISIQFIDKEGNSRTWTELPLDVSELLQHEIDHLDGVLAVDRAIDRDAIVEREAFESMKHYFAKQVDYVIS